MWQKHQVGNIERNTWDQNITPSNNNQNEMGQTKEVTDMLNKVLIPEVWIMKIVVLVVPLTTAIDVDAGCCLITVLIMQFLFMYLW